MEKLAASAALSSELQSLIDEFHNHPLKPIIVEIAKDGCSGQVSKPDLEDDQKRWLIVGICLHSVISPALRQYIPNTVSKIYNSLVLKNKINVQGFQNYLKRYKPTNNIDKELIYESINNNSAIPKVKGKPDIAKYDYRVTSDVDFSKLLLPTNMAQYTGFDSSCDSSALLGIIINIDFPQPLQIVAKQQRLLDDKIVRLVKSYHTVVFAHALSLQLPVLYARLYYFVDSNRNLTMKNSFAELRRDVRNPWAHCNLSEWDVIKYQSSLQLMFQLVKNLKLPISEETTVMGALMQWQTNGIHLLQGTTIGLELLQQLKKETQALCKYMLEVVVPTDECIKSVIVKIDETLNATKHMVHELKTDSSKLKIDMECVSVEIGDLKASQTQLHSLCKDSSKEISDLQAKTKTLDNQKVVDKQSIDEIKTDMAHIRSELTEASNNIIESKTEILYNRNVVNEIKIDVDRNRSEINEAMSRCIKNESDIIETKIDVQKNRDDIEKLSQQVSCSRVSQNSFFFVPDKVLTFVAREEEIEQLHTNFSSTRKQQNTVIICGLGGIGKTTLSVEFAWRYQTFYPGGIFWMSAESNDALEDSIQRLAIHIDKMGRDNNETLHKVLSWLSLLQDQWLLIIDNADFYELFGAIKELVHGSWKRSSKGHVVITSRRKASEAESDFHVIASDCITLDVLSVSESKEFMIRRSGAIEDKNDSSLDTLVNELGGLPLALEQASSHIHKLKCTYTDYLDKFERKRLKFMQKSKSRINIPKERQTVLTTWHLNFDFISKQSEDEGLATAAVTAMKVSAFLYADDIPLCVFNVGSPNVDDKDIIDCLQDVVGVSQISAILSGFSLFRETRPKTLSVHRLVQEVIREELKDENEKKLILECAVRMVNKALELTRSPVEAIKERQIERTSLLLWSKLCLHANAVRKHLLEFVKTNTGFNAICLNAETAKLLQASSIYHSFNQRQDEALACQEQMLNILPAVDISESALRDFTSIKIPLLNNVRLIIQENLITNTMSPEKSAVLLDPETLRIEGNQAFHLHKYHAAIQYYSEAVRASGQVDLRILSNRSLAYLKICDYENALIDAEKCISEYQGNKPTKLMHMYKPYLWKAYAIANLIRLGQLPKCYGCIGLASAAFAGYHNSQCLLEYRMKVEYPIVRFVMIENGKEFTEQISSLSNRTYTTFLLRKGRYEITFIAGLFQIVKSMQVIGVEDAVEVLNPLYISLSRPESYWFSIKLDFERELNIHFENVVFPSESGRVFVEGNVNAIFYKCKFSNGRKACEKFPLCKGDVGCRNSSPSECTERYSFHENENRRIVCGVPGEAGLGQKGKGRVVVDNCIFDRCGGGGICSEGKDAIMVIKNCEIRNMRQMGVEARYGATIRIENCTVINNQFHGVAIGPKAFGTVENCIIRGNGEEGIWCGEIFNPVYKEKQIEPNVDPNRGSVCIIKGNSISHNGLSGISFDGGSYEVSGNRIFENWLWGMLVNARSASSIYNNDVFENKCGGIRIGYNYSAPIVVDGNTVRDHTGPAIYIEGTAIRRQDELQSESLLDDDVEGLNYYSVSPFVTTRNLYLNNDRGQCHPTEFFIPVQTCCYCHNIFNKLQKCGKCKKATYCSKHCQRADWKRHKNICTILYSSYTVEIEMSETFYMSKYPGNEYFRKTFITTVPLPDLGKGTPPDRNSCTQFMVKIQSGKEYTRYDPMKFIRIYDQTLTIYLEIRNPELYHLVCECGVLAGLKYTTKKIYCWASFKNKGSRLCIHTDNLPPFQHRW